MESLKQTDQEGVFLRGKIPFQIKWRFGPSSLLGQIIIYVDLRLVNKAKAHLRQISIRIAIYAITPEVAELEVSAFDSTQMSSIGLHNM